MPTVGTIRITNKELAEAVFKGPRLYTILDVRYSHEERVTYIKVATRTLSELVKEVEEMEREDG